MLFPTSLVGSYPQPDWLIDRAKLAGRFPPRVRATELWRVQPEFLDQAQQDATLLAIRAQEDAGLDIITDGEIRRESYSNAFATALDGIDIDNPGIALDRSGHPNPVPRITGPIKRRHAVNVEALQFLRAHTDRTIKVTVPGPFTMAEQAQNDYYPSKEAAAFGYAEAVNAEIADLFAAGADIVQLDEPYLQARSETAKQYGVKVLNAALDGITGTTAVHLCFGYAAIIHDRPSGYSFLPELAATTADQISIETAQSGLDCAVLAELARQDDHSRRPEPRRHCGRDARGRRRPGRAGARLRASRAHRAGAGLRDEVPAARVGGRQAGGHDAGSPAAARRDRRPSAHGAAALAAHRQLPQPRQRARRLLAAIGTSCLVAGRAAAALMQYSGVTWRDLTTAWRPGQKRLKSPRPGRVSSGKRERGGSSGRFGSHQGLARRADPSPGWRLGHDAAGRRAGAAGTTAARSSASTLTTWPATPTS